MSPDDGEQLAELKPFVRDLMQQMERDLETKLDWVAVDHYNTGHPHTRTVIRGKAEDGRDPISLAICLRGKIGSNLNRAVIRLTR